MSKREIFDISVELLHETEKAILVTHDGGKTRAWLPKSAVEYERESDGSYTVTAPVKLLTEKGLV